MKILVIVTLGVALVAAGCVVTSGQFRISFDLGTVPVGSPTTVVGKDVDLNSISTYKDHKGNLDALADLALLGDVTNNSSSAVDVEAWMTTDQTSYTTDAQVRTGTRIWGPLHLDPSETKRIDWGQSAGLFDDAGVTTLLGELKGDGIFTIYLVGTGTSYNFTLQNGVLVLTLDAGV
jgi:hypothetical protein